MTKKRCPKCKRLLRTRCFKKNKLTKEEICESCDKKIGSNKFYTPLKHKKNKKITNSTMTTDEQKVLAMKKGWSRVKSDCEQLQNLKKKIKFKKIDDLKTKESTKQKNKELNKKFIEGLK